MMGQEISYVLLWNITIALGLGLLVGLERERAGKEVGLRTFSFGSLLGFLGWTMGQPYTIAALAFVAVLVIVFNISALQKGSGVESTTSISLFIVTLVGMFVAAGHLFTAVAVIILMLMFLSFKEEMVVFSKHLQRNELHAAITLGLLSFVILPVLPTGAVDPWGLFDLRKVWFMVVLISAIGFGNYILLKLYGAKGITYTGFLGGLVNSTAAAAELAEKARTGPDGMEDYAFCGIMWAKTAAFLRNGIILGIFAPKAFMAGLIPGGLVIGVTLVLAVKSSRHLRAEPPEIDLESPFSLTSALSFGLIFAVITMVAGLAQQAGGSLGFYAVSFAGGMVSSASTAATAANLQTAGRITPIVSAAGVILASIASAVVILPIVWKGSSRPTLVRRVFVAISWIFIALVVGMMVNPILLHQYNVIKAWISL